MSEIYEVQQQRDADRALEVYYRAYEKRYRTKPILSNNQSDSTIIRDLARQVGGKRLCELLEHYLQMDNEWFAKKAHSIEVFRTEINVVNSDYGLRATKHKTPSGARILSAVACDKCGERIIISVPIGHNWDVLSRCRVCGGEFEYRKEDK